MRRVSSSSFSELVCWAANLDLKNFGSVNFVNLKTRQLSPYNSHQVVWWNDFWVSNRSKRADLTDIAPEPKGIDNLCQAVSQPGAFANDKHCRRVLPDRPSSSDSPVFHQPFRTKG